MPKAANDGARSSVLPCHSQPFDVSFAVFSRTCGYFVGARRKTVCPFSVFQMDCLIYKRNVFYIADELKMLSTSFILSARHISQNGKSSGRTMVMTMPMIICSGSPTFT